MNEHGQYLERTGTEARRESKSLVHSLEIPNPVYSTQTDPPSSDEPNASLIPVETDLDAMRRSVVSQADGEGKGGPHAGQTTTRRDYAKP